MAYPALNQLVSTQKLSVSGRNTLRAVSGKPYFYNFYTQLRNAFQVAHECTGAQKSSVLAHYATNRMKKFDFLLVAENTTYSCQYATTPKVTALEGDDHWRVEVVLIETDRQPFGIVVLSQASTTVATGERTNREKAAVVTSVGSFVLTLKFNKGKVVAISCNSSVTVAKTTARSNTVTMSDTATVTATGVAA